MSAIQIQRSRLDATIIGKAMVTMPSPGSSPTSVLMAEKLKNLKEPTPTFSGARPDAPRSLEEQLYDALAAFKIQTAQVAMHLDREWRTSLRQLDSLLAPEDWEADDPPPTLGSYSTFLRMLTMLRPKRRPGLGATDDGHLIATWTTGDDRLTLECLPKDIVRWHLSVTINGERERAAAETPLYRLTEVLRAYDPSRWFNNADNLSSASASYR